ncbi:MAG: procyclic acidic repetitive family protein [Corynebacterium sp.]|nr:procyclic acidic repetitive family protein [Corynebacterium sp.]
MVQAAPSRAHADDTTPTTTGDCANATLNPTQSITISPSAADFDNGNGSITKMFRLNFNGMGPCFSWDVDVPDPSLGIEVATSGSNNMFMVKLEEPASNITGIGAIPGKRTIKLNIRLYNKGYWDKTDAERAALTPLRTESVTLNLNSHYSAPALVFDTSTGDKTLVSNIGTIDASSTYFVDNPRNCDSDGNNCAGQRFTYNVGSPARINNDAASHAPAEWNSTKLISQQSYDKFDIYQNGPDATLVGPHSVYLLGPKLPSMDPSKLSAIAGSGTNGMILYSDGSLPSDLKGCDVSVTSGCVSFIYQRRGDSSWTTMNGAVVDKLPAGTYQLRARYVPLATQQNLVIYDSDPVSISVPQVTSPVAVGTATGSIQALDPSVSYSLTGDSIGTRNFSGTSSITGLSAGTYTLTSLDDDVRTTITIGPGATRPAPQGLGVVAASSPTAKDGMITGLMTRSSYDYHKVGDSNWNTVSNVSAITGLSAGTYEIRFAKDKTNSSDKPAVATVVLGSSAIPNTPAQPSTDAQPTTDPEPTKQPEPSKDPQPTDQTDPSKQPDPSKEPVPSTSADKPSATSAPKPTTAEKFPDATDPDTTKPASTIIDAPTGLSTMPATSATASDGSIFGLDPAQSYQYRTVNADAYGPWVIVNANSRAIAGLPAGNYDVRISPNSSTLVSRPTRVTIDVVPAAATTTPNGGSSVRNNTSRILWIVLAIFALLAGGAGAIFAYVNNSKS